MASQMTATVIRLIAVLAVVGAALCAVVVYLMARMLLRPRRMTETKAIYVLKRLSPMDLGMAYEESKYTVRDEHLGVKLKLSAWWIEAAKQSSRCAVLIHGYGDAKVGAIAWAPMLRELGFNIFIPDLRAHGESEGVETTAGFWERHDVSLLIDQIKDQRPSETRDIVIFGISLGAAVAAATGAMREDVSAVILESPFSKYPEAIQAHAREMGMPGPMLVRAGIRMAERMSGASFEEVAPVKMIPQVKGKVMVITAGDDPLVGADCAGKLEAAVNSRNDGSVYWKIPTAYHVEGMRGDYQEYRRRVAEFLGDAERREENVNIAGKSSLGLTSDAS
jgi:pimeloyl-ACP methyl ester carboxylesterase